MGVCTEVSWVCVVCSETCVIDDSMLVSTLDVRTLVNAKLVAVGAELNDPVESSCVDKSVAN